MGDHMYKLIKSRNNAQGLNCKIGDYLDNLDQRSLMVKTAINVQDPDLKKKIDILETGDYNSFNLNMLVTEVNIHYKTSIDATDDLQSAKRVSRSGTIVLSFYDNKLVPSSLSWSMPSRPREAMQRVKISTQTLS